MDYGMEWGKGDCPARENGIPMDRKLLAKSFLSGEWRMVLMTEGIFPFVCYNRNGY